MVSVFCLHLENVIYDGYYHPVMCFCPIVYCTTGTIFLIVVQISKAKACIGIKRNEPKYCMSHFTQGGDYPVPNISGITMGGVTQCRGKNG